ncbi:MULTISPECIES: glutathione S-transferase family protein [unclassified Paraburkholderia]|uniref:glutathione S-transferase family protein n=1 Tax=unclassified Paraburkholderia TaxID=2615204 RepID=UPI002AB17E54|nr:MULTISPECIES: glutathione S-transferase family protein [unclassified Paraburkholderia]
MLKLYDDELCGDSYKARLLMGLLGLEAERIRVERYPSRQHDTPAFRELSPLGALPVLQDDTTTLADAHAILVWLAQRYDAGGTWLSANDARVSAQVQRWLGVATSLSQSVFARREQVLHDIGAPLPAADREARPLLRLLDETCWFNEAMGTPFLCATRMPTIADIACFVPVALLDEAQIDTIDYPSLATWCARIKRLQGFVTMAGVYAAYS